MHIKSAQRAGLQVGCTDRLHQARSHDWGADPPMRRLKTP